MSVQRIIFDTKQSLLHIYVLLRSYESLEECLQSKEYDINNCHYIMSFLDDVTPFGGWTPLHVSVAINDLKSVKILVKYGADINARTGVHEYTPLHIAVKNESSDMTQLLIQLKADLNAQNGYKKTPLELCPYNPDLYPLLVESGADYKTKFFEKHPLIFRAIHSKNLRLVELLAKQQKIGIYYQNKSLIEWAIDDFPECVPLLIESGLQIHYSSSETGEYPIHSAIRMKRFLWIEMLCKNGCNTNVSNREGNRPLHIAVQTDCPKEVAILLISSNANRSLKNNNGLTPFHCAVEKGNEELTELFMRIGTPLTRNLSELERAIRFKKFKSASILLNYIQTIDNNIRFDSESIIWFFVKHCVGEHEAEDRDLTNIMQKLIDLTSDVNQIDSVWGSLMHFLIYADVCAPTHCLKILFNVLIRSLKYDINYEFKPKDTRLKTGEEVPVERIMANGTPLSFALEMANCEYYAEELIGMGAEHTTINWDHIFFAPNKVKSLKMLVNCGAIIPSYFRFDSDPSFDESLDNEKIDYFGQEFKKFIDWWDRRQSIPLSLKQMSTNAVRKAIGSTCLRQLSTRGLESKFETFPQMLNDYILYKDFEEF